MDEQQIHVLSLYYSPATSDPQGVSHIANTADIEGTWILMYYENNPRLWTVVTIVHGLLFRHTYIDLANTLPLHHRFSFTLRA